MIDRFNIELTAGNKDRIAVEPWHGRVSIFVVDGSGSVEGEAHVVMEPAECDALIAAIGRALGRPAPTSTPLSTEDKRAAVYRIQRAVPKGYAYSYTDLITDLGDAIGAELDRAAAREQGATVPRAGVLPILDDLRSIATALDFENTPGACSAWRRLEEAIGTLAKLTAAPTTQTEKG